MSKFVQTVDHEEPIATTREGYAELGHEARPLLSAIREKCIECSGWSPKEVRLCRVTSCALFPFRMGSNPWRKEMTPEARQQVGNRLKARKPLPIGGEYDGDAEGAQGSSGDQLRAEKTPVISTKKDGDARPGTDGSVQL
jgi:hypothetical protein